MLIGFTPLKIDLCGSVDDHGPMRSSDAQKSAFNASGIHNVKVFSPQDDVVGFFDDSRYFACPYDDLQVALHIIVFAFI
jgi:hypothetical protein